MKKLISVLLASALAFTLAAVVLAADDLRNAAGEAPSALHVDAAHPLLIDEDGAATPSDLAAYGKTLCYALYADEALTAPLTRMTDLADLKVSADWEEGGAYVRSVELVRRSVSQNGAEKAAGCYVAVTASAGAEEPIEVAGTIRLKGTVKNGDTRERINHRFPVSFTIGYERVTLTDADDSADVDETPRLYDFTACGEEEFTIAFGNVAEAVTDVSRMDEAVLSYNTDDLEILHTVYNRAELEIVTLQGKFRRTADVTLYAEEGRRLYEYANGRVTPVNAVYDEEEKGFVFKTKVLGTYVISNAALPSVQIGQPQAQTPRAPANPSTGAAI